MWYSMKGPPMKRFLAALALLVVAFGVFVMSESASAKDTILNSFISAYPATGGSALANCTTCHTSVPTLNPYGSALKASGLNFTAIEGLDSDGDGFTNLQEIRNLTNPGVVSDRPQTTTSTTAASTTTSTSTTSTTSTTGATGTTSTTGATSTTSTTTVSTAGATAAPVAQVVLAGATAFEVKGVGTVSLAIEGGRLVVKQVASSWKYTVESDEDNEIEVKFRSGDREVEFEAVLKGGTIRTKVETESDDDHDSDRIKSGADDDDDHDSDQRADGEGDDDDDHNDDHDDD